MVDMNGIRHENDEHAYTITGSIPTAIKIIELTVRGSADNETVETEVV